MVAGPGGRRAAPGRRAAAGAVRRAGPGARRPARPPPAPGRRPRAAGVIDWGDVCLADPAVDLALGYAAFAGPARAALLDAYGGVGAERELRARCLAVRLSALLAGYAAADDRPALLAEALAGIGRAVV